MTTAPLPTLAIPRSPQQAELAESDRIEHNLAAAVAAGDTRAVRAAKAAKAAFGRRRQQATDALAARIPQPISPPAKGEVERLRAQRRKLTGKIERAQAERQRLLTALTRAPEDETLLAAIDAVDGVLHNLALQLEAVQNREAAISRFVADRENTRRLKAESERQKKAAVHLAGLEHDLLTTAAAIPETWARLVAELHRLDSLAAEIATERQFRTLDPARDLRETLQKATDDAIRFTPGGGFGPGKWSISGEVRGGE